MEPIETQVMASFFILLEESDIPEPVVVALRAALADLDRLPSADKVTEILVLGTRDEVS